MGFRINADQITTQYTQTLASFVDKLRYDDIPSDVHDRAVYAVMHAVGEALSAKGTPLGKKAVSLGKVIGSGEPAATLWTDGAKVSMAAAAFTAGVLCTAPADGSVPTAFVVCDALKKSGRDCITAVVAGIEVSQRIARVVHPPELESAAVASWPDAWRIFAALVPAAKLMGLTGEQIEQAFGFGCLTCPVPGNAHRSAEGDARRFEHGFRASDGIFCAETALVGIDNYTGCFDDPHSWDYFMASEPQRSWYIKELGTTWLTQSVFVPDSMSAEEHIELFRSRASAALSGKKLDRAAEALFHLASLEDISVLSEYLY